MTIRMMTMLTAAGAMMLGPAMLASAAEGATAKAGERATAKKPRDAASGLATGKRIHKPLRLRKGAKEGRGLKKARDDASMRGRSQPTGKRIHKPAALRKKLRERVKATRAKIKKVVPRDAASGRPTGKR